VDANREWGGGQAQSLGLALALAARGEETRFVAEPGSAPAARLGDTLLPWEAVRMRGARRLGATIQLTKRFRELRPEVVHIHDSASHVPAALAAKRAGVPAVVATRRTAFPLRRGWAAKLKHELWCDRLLCVSEAVRRRCLEAGLPEDHIAVVPDFVDCQHFDTAIVETSRTDERPRICSVGRLSREKGHLLLLKAMSIVVKSVPEAQLQICGEGPELSTIARRAEVNGLAENVALLGFVRDVRSLLAAADVFVMPSLSEGLGVAVLEAMAMGKPVVATDAGGLPEAVMHGETGLVVPAGDAEALAEAMTALLEKPTRAREMGRAGRQRALSHFDRPRIVDRVVAHYEEVLAKGGR
jgi:glycosyltransferase involved in cell wall biosynthesis